MQEHLYYKKTQSSLFHIASILGGGGFPFFQKKEKNGNKTKKTTPVTGEWPNGYA